MRLLFIAFLFLFASQSSALCVSSDTANLRAGPGANHPVTWTVGKYTPFLQIESSKGWYKVKDMDGALHWIYHTLVSTRLKCVSVKTHRANLRTGPGTKFSYASYQIADKYFPFKRINRKEEWYHLMDASGNKFWLHESTIWIPKKMSLINF